MAKPMAQTKAAPAKAPTSLFAKKLRGMKEAWSASKEKSKTSFGITVPSGRYTAQLTDTGLIDFGDDVGAKMTFNVLEGDETGETIELVHNITDPDRVVWFQRDLRKLGVEVDEIDPEQIEQLLKELLEAAPTARIKVTENKGGYTNANVEKLLDASVVEGAAEVAAEDPGEVVDEPEAGEEVEAEAEAEAEVEAEAEAEVEAEPEAEAEAEAEPEAEAEEEAPAFNAKDRVSYTVKGKKYTGVITKVNPNNGNLTITDDKTKNAVVVKGDPEFVSVLPKIAKK